MKCEHKDTSDRHVTEVLLKPSLLQGGATGSDDERPSGYQPRPLTIGTAPISASLSASQLSANDGDEEVCTIQHRREKSHLQ